MWKYYALMVLVLGLGLYYVYVSDPCQNQMATEFASRYPGYEILHTGAEEGSPESVRCRISYKRPDREQAQEEVWLYLNPGSGWKFSRVLRTSDEEQAVGARDESPGR